MSLHPSPEPDADLIHRCATRSLPLLRENLTPQGILAASRTEAAEARSYTRIFGRDAAICVLAMVGSADDALEQGALDSLDSLAKLQAANGQIPKYVDPAGKDADFDGHGGAELERRHLPAGEAGAADGCISAFSG